MGDVRRRHPDHVLADLPLAVAGVDLQVAVEQDEAVGVPAVDVQRRPALGAEARVGHHELWAVGQDEDGGLGDVDERLAGAGHQTARKSYLEAISAMRCGSSGPPLAATSRR